MAQLISMIMISIIPKFTPMYLTDHLTHKEFRCKCKSKTCHFTLVAKSLLKSYKETRLEFGIEIIVTSGHRCQLHNLHEGGVDKSSHTMGLAIDIRPVDLKDLDLLEEIARKHFKFVQRRKNFIHCHNLE